MNHNSKENPDVLMNQHGKNINEPENISKSEHDSVSGRYSKPFYVNESGQDRKP